MSDAKHALPTWEEAFDRIVDGTDTPVDRVVDRIHLLPEKHGVRERTCKDFAQALTEALRMGREEAADEFSKDDDLGRWVRQKIRALDTEFAAETQDEEGEDTDTCAPGGGSVE